MQIRMKGMKNIYACFPEIKLTVIYPEETTQIFTCQINLAEI